MCSSTLFAGTVENPQPKEFRSDLEVFAANQRPTDIRGVWVTAVTGDYVAFTRLAQRYGINCAGKTMSTPARTPIRPVAYLYYPIADKFRYHEDEKFNYPGIVCPTYGSWLIDLVTGSDNVGTDDDQFTLISLIYQLMSNIGRYFYPPFLVMATIYIMFMGFRVMQGNGTLMSMIKELAFITVLGILLSGLRDPDDGGVYRDIMGTIFDMHNFMLGMSFVDPNTAGGYGQSPATLSATIDGVHAFNEAYADAFWHSTYFKLVLVALPGSDLGPGLYMSWTGGICALIIKFSGMVNIWGATEALLVSKMVVLVLSVVGPVFLSLYLFPQTRKFTQQWIAELFEQLFTAMLIGVMLRLLLGRIFGVVAGMGAGGITVESLALTTAGSGVGAAAGAGLGYALVVGAGASASSAAAALLAPVIVGGAALGSFLYITVTMTSLNAIFWLIIKQSSRIAGHLTGGFGMEIFANAATNNMVKWVTGAAAAAAGGIAGGVAASGGVAAAAAAAEGAAAAATAKGATGVAASQAGNAASQAVSREYFNRSIDVAKFVGNQTQQLGQAIGSGDPYKAISTFGSTAVESVGYSVNRWKSLEGPEVPKASQGISPKEVRNMLYPNTLALQKTAAPLPNVFTSNQKSPTSLPNAFSSNQKVEEPFTGKPLNNGKKFS